MTDKLLTANTVHSITSLSRTTIWRLHTKGLFPKPMKVPGSHHLRWRESEVQAWIAGKWENK